MVAIALEVYVFLIVFIVVDTPGVVSTFSVVLGRVRASRRRSVATQLTVGGRASRRAHWINVLQFLFVTRDESFLAFFFCPPPLREEICRANGDKLILIAVNGFWVAVFSSLSRSWTNGNYVGRKEHVATRNCKKCPAVYHADNTDGLYHKYVSDAEKERILLEIGSRRNCHAAPEGSRSRDDFIRFGMGTARVGNIAFIHIKKETEIRSNGLGIFFNTDKMIYLSMWKRCPSFFSFSYFLYFHCISDCLALF